MARPSRDQIEQMAFMAMMDGIIHTSVPCSCATCKSEGKSKTGTRSQPPAKRFTSDNLDTARPVLKTEHSGSCNHNHSTTESKPIPSAKKTNSTPSQGKNAPSSPVNSARSDKVNALLKADSVQAVFDVFNQTNNSKDEKDLAARIQNATKDCKLYQESKDKILELCDDEDVDLDAVFGLLAKFRYERNMLTTAVIKGNSEREKALLCIQRVDHLMYMLQDVAKRKDSKGNDVMHKLGDIIMEIHDLAKTPSTLYDEFLDIKEEHFDLLNDHEEMHQKFVDVNSCHEKLHTSHDKLQTEHNKLLRDYADAKKKASTVGGLKNDITRLEKVAEKNGSETSDLKKEIDRLNAELAKVNALKHENTQLKKKVATLSIQPIAVEETPPTTQAQAGKKKKGKKLAADVSTNKPATPEPPPVIDRSVEIAKAHEDEINKLKSTHGKITQELDLARANLKQLDALVRKTESARDQAVEKLEVEKATSRNWKDIANGHLSERDRLRSEVDRHVTRATRLQTTVKELEQTLCLTKNELAEQVEAHKQFKDDLEQRSPTPAVSVASHQTANLGSETIRLLRKIRSETSQLARDLDESRSYGPDIYSVFDMIQLTVRRVVNEVERDIEEILSVKGNDPPVSHSTYIPEAVLPFTYNTAPPRQTAQISPRLDYSPQESPRVPSSTTLPPYRPMPPPPGFESSPSPFSHNQYHAHPRVGGGGGGLDSPSMPFSRIVEPPGLSANLGFNRPIEPPMATNPRYTNPIAPPSSSSLHSYSSLQSSNAVPHPNVGVIGSKPLTNNKTNTSPSPISTPASNAGPSTTTSSNTAANTITPTSSASGLGNGAVGVDWNMWTRSGR